MDLVAACGQRELSHAGARDDYLSGEGEALRATANYRSRILDLDEGRWDGKLLEPVDCIISADEKPSKLVPNMPGVVVPVLGLRSELTAGLVPLRVVLAAEMADADLFTTFSHLEVVALV